MKKELFDQLLESIKEAGAIARGELKPARVKTFEAVDARAIREKFGVTQLAFSRMIGVSLGTLRNWEQGRRSPHGPARVLLLLAAAQPDLVRRVIAERRRGVGEWVRESNVLTFTSTRAWASRPPRLAGETYTVGPPVLAEAMGGKADDRASATA